MLNEKSQKLMPSLQHLFEGIIWKIVLDEYTPTIVVQTRDIENKKAFLSAFNFLNGDIYFLEKELENSWDLNVDSMYKGYIYLYGYRNPSIPERNGIICLNLKGEIVWQHYSWALEQVCSNGLLVYDVKIQPRKSFLVEYATGKYLSSPDKAVENMAYSYTFPTYLDEIPDGLLSPGCELVGLAHYLNFNEKEIWAFHDQESGVISQHLMLLNKAREVLLSLNLEENILKLNPESFFVFSQHLFCVRNKKREIVSYWV